MVRITVTTMERRMDAHERRMNEFRAELHNQRDDFREWMKQAELRLQKKRRRGRSRRPHEESSETVEPATVKRPTVMRKSEKVEEKMEKNMGNLKLQFTDVAKSTKHVDGELGTQQQKIEIAAVAVAGDFHELPPEPPDRYVFTAKVWEFHDSGAQLSFSTTGENDSGVAEWPLEEVK